MQTPVTVLIAPDPDAQARAEAAALVTQLLLAQARQAEASKEVADAKERLARLPAGRYAGVYAGQFLHVVAETTALKPTEAQVDAARKICGPHADVLFKRVETVAYKPVDGLRDIARVLLSPRRFAQLVALCEVPVRAHVRS